jgi:hypothetical protein
MSRVKSEMEFKGRRALGRVGDNDKSCAPSPPLRLHVRLHVQPLCRRLSTLAIRITLCSSPVRCLSCIFVSCSLNHTNTAWLQLQVSSLPVRGQATLTSHARRLPRRNFKPCPAP